MATDSPYELLVGTRGWTDESWAARFYSEDTPPEWYFLAYSNDFRSVLVPADMWNTVNGRDIERWLEESDPGFSFTIEPPVEILHASDDRRQRLFDDFTAMIAPLKDQTAGFLLDLRDLKPQPKIYEQLFRLFVQHHPVCVNLSALVAGDESIISMQRRLRIGTCWHCDTDPMPQQTGDFLVALSSGAEPKRIRGIVEQLGTLLEDNVLAGMYFTGSRAPDEAWQARIIAELMGV